MTGGRQRVPIPRDVTPQGRPVGWSEAKASTFSLPVVLKMLGCVWLLTLVISTTVLLSGGQQATGVGTVVPGTANPAPATTFSPAVEIDLRTLERGDCYYSAIDPDRGSVTSCADAHDGEVVGSVPLAPQSALSDAQLGALCRPLLTAGLIHLVDEEVLALTWSLPAAGSDTLTCRLERGIHVAPLEGPLAGV
jgi:hypothetical protein